MNNPLAMLTLSVALVAFCGGQQAVHVVADGLVQGGTPAATVTMDVRMADTWRHTGAAPHGE